MLSLIQKILAMMIACLFSAAAGLSAAEPEMREIGDGVYSFTIGEGNYSMLVVGDDGVAVFETFHSGHAGKLLEAVKSVTDRPVRYAFISHNHWDHASGGQVFSDAGVPTVMHQLAADWITANPGRDTSPPDMTWSGDRKDIAVGDFTVRMHYLGLNHGLGMTVFTVPERRVAYIADLVTPNRVQTVSKDDFGLCVLSICGE